MNLTTIAALPGSGSGCISAVKPEEGAGLAKPTVQMRAPYFDQPDELLFPPIDLGPIGGTGAADKQGFEPFDYAERS